MSQHLRHTETWERIEDRGTRCIEYVYDDPTVARLRPVVRVANACGWLLVWSFRLLVCVPFASAAHAFVWGCRKFVQIEDQRLRELGEPSTFRSLLPWRHDASAFDDRPRRLEP